MRDIKIYARECQNMLDALKIKYASHIEFTVNSRAKSRLGLCKKKGDRYTIEISSALLDKRASEALLTETIIHELLHTCYGCMKHTGRWKALAEKVNAAYGYNIRRAAEEDSIPDDLKPEPKYIIKCTSCGLEINRQKRSALVKNPSRYRCGKCGGRVILVKK